jgi:hypothetical protein
VSFLNVLKGILHIGEAVGPQVATAINPAAGALVGIVVNAVTQAEQKGGTGPDKKQEVMTQVLPVAESILGAVLQAKGVKIDNAQLNTAMSNIVDGVVALMNSIGGVAATTAGGSPSATPAAPAPKPGA